MEENLPVDIAVFAAAVADFRPKTVATNKIKKTAGVAPQAIELMENPDILKTISAHKNRPKLVIGFAAETENLLKNASEKLARKGCDWILANDVAGGKVFEEYANEITFIGKKNTEQWQKMSKKEVARKLVKKIIVEL